MTFLRNIWRRGFVYRYFAGLDPLDQVTAIVVLALLTAFVVSYSAIVSYPMPVPA